jgi:hypothetical protein
MRTPWREAIDGKAKVLRDLRTPISEEVLSQYFEESASFKKMVGAASIERKARGLARKYAQIIADGVRRAEPFWVWDTIGSSINEHLLASPPIGDTFRVSDAPVPEGLIWFQTPVPLVHEEDDDLTWVRAIFFGEASVAAFDKDLELGMTSDKDHIAMVAFIDSTKSGITTTAGAYFLMPWMCNAIRDGTVFDDYTRGVMANTPDLNHTDFTLSTWPVAFCMEFFRLLQQKLLLYGGSGLEREARREAKRHGFEPSVRVVEWRKAEYRYPEGHIPARVDWSCQWVVKPHLRRYKSGKVVTVRSYTKGPSDKPLKQIDHRVNVVKR